MISNREIIVGLLLPLVVAGIFSAIAAWRDWAWLLPVAAGGAFVWGYWRLIDGPKLPPIAGSDWLLWTSAAAALLGAAATLVRPAWAGALALIAGVSVYVIAKPLSPHAVSPAALWTTAVLVALASVAVIAALTWSASRVPAAWVAGGLVAAIAGAAVLALACGFRTMAVYGMSAAAALAPAAAAAFWFKASNPRSARAMRGLAVYGVAVLAGVLTAARFYPEPGVSWTQFALLILSPALAAAAAFVPGRRQWVRGVIALTAVGALVAAVTGPPALRAKRAAETPNPADSYSDYYSQ
jgi:hypothetical protein